MLREEDLGDVRSADAEARRCPRRRARRRIERERSVALKPSARSRQWPRESARSLCSSRAGMRTTSTSGDEERDGVDRVRGRRARRRRQNAAEESARSAQLRFSTVWSSAFASGSCRVGHEVRNARVDGRPEEAGREARDGASATIVAALGANGSATKTPTGPGRRRSSARAARAGRAAARAGSPTTTVGRNSTMSTAPTQSGRSSSGPGRRSQRDGGDQRPDARAERREEEVPEPREPERRRAGRSEPHGLAPTANSAAG